MIVTPRPGANREGLLQTLRNVHNQVVNLLGGGGPGPAQVRVLSYLDWASSAVRLLDYQVSQADVAELILTPGYNRLLSAATLTGSDIGTQRVLNGMVGLELELRAKAFEAAITTLQAQITRWSSPGVFAAPDTSFYIEHGDKLEDADFRPLLQIWHDPVHVLVPIVVVDELDGLKKSKDAHTRWRAGYTLAVLDRVLGTNPAAPARLRAEDFSQLGMGLPSGEVSIEILFDPSGRVRLPIVDDEIIDRIIAVEPVAARRVTLLTYDTGQATRGRAAGLQVRKLDKPDPGAGHPPGVSNGKQKAPEIAAPTR